MANAMEQWASGNDSVSINDDGSISGSDGGSGSSSTYTSSDGGNDRNAMDQWVSDNENWSYQDGEPVDTVEADEDSAGSVGGSLDEDTQAILRAEEQQAAAEGTLDELAKERVGDPTVQASDAGSVNVREPDSFSDSVNVTGGDVAQAAEELDGVSTSDLDGQRDTDGPNSTTSTDSMPNPDPAPDTDMPNVPGAAILSDLRGQVGEGLGGGLNLQGLQEDPRQWVEDNPKQAGAAALLILWVIS